MDATLLKKLNFKSSRFTKRPELLNYYGLEGNPFHSSNGSEYFPSNEFKKYATEIQCQLKDGPKLLIVEGIAGIGKTSFEKHLAHDLSTTKQLHLSLDLSQTIKEKLQTGIDQEDQLELNINDLITKDATVGNKQVVMFFDDAHELDISQLELLSDVVGQSNEKRKTSVILFCRPKFVEEIGQSDSSDIRQNVSRCYSLHSFRYPETVRFIEYKLYKAGQLFISNLFDEQALKCIHDESRGVPRRIQTIVKALMVFAHEKRRPRIDLQLIYELWSHVEETHFLSVSNNESIIDPVSSSYPHMRHSTSHIVSHRVSSPYKRLNNEATDFAKRVKTRGDESEIADYVSSLSKEENSEVYIEKKAENVPNPLDSPNENEETDQQNEDLIANSLEVSIESDYETINTENEKQKSALDTIDESHTDPENTQEIISSASEDYSTSEQDDEQISFAEMVKRIVLKETPASTNDHEGINESN